LHRGTHPNSRTGVCRGSRAPIGRAGQEPQAAPRGTQNLARRVAGAAGSPGSRQLIVNHDRRESLSNVSSPLYRMTRLA